MKIRAVFLLPAVLAASPSAAAPDAAAGIRGALDARSERAVDPVEAPRPAHLLGAATTGLLFSMTGPDNAVCVRAVPDVTGDGLDEIVVGIDESGTDNVFCLDGASLGTATPVWSIETMDGVSGGAPYGDQSVVPSSDVDGNTHGNVLVGTGGGRTAYNLDTLDGSVIWKLDTYLETETGWVYSLAELNDLDGDAVPEVAFGVGSDNNGLSAVDGSSGPGQAEPLWRFPAGDAVYSVRDLGDVDGDGLHDVLAAVGDNVDWVVALDGGSEFPTGNVLWTYDPDVTVFAVGVLPDITEDGIDEALAVLWTTLGGSSIRCLNGATGLLEWQSTQVSDFGQMVDVLEDVDGDGLAEVIVSSWENAVIVLSGADGSQIWKTSVGTTNGGDVWTARARFRWRHQRLLSSLRSSLAA
jgi:outer membrane protein assembly factor BamB